MSDTYERFTEILTTRFEVEPDEIRPDATFDDLDLDSLFITELVLVLQKEFAINLREEDLSPRSTLGAAIVAIEGELARAS